MELQLFKVCNLLNIQSSISLEIIRLTEMYKIKLPSESIYILYIKLVMLFTYLSNPSIQSCLYVIKINNQGVFDLPPAQIGDSFMWLFHKELIQFKLSGLSDVFFNHIIKQIYSDTLSAFILEDHHAASLLIPLLSSAFNDELNSRLFEQNDTPLSFKGNTFIGDEAVRQLAIFMKSTNHNLSLYLQYIKS